MVLSAAHCGGVVATVAVQRHNLNDRTVGDDVTVKYEVLHPQHDPRSTDNDFSLIFLSRSTTADVDLVQLNKDKSVPMSGDDVTVMGWGDTVAFDSIQQLSDTLKEVEVTAISNAECEVSSGRVGNWFFGSYESYQGQITDNMLCAEDNGEDSCQGDSGGPLVLASSDESGDVQVGVVSWGIGCASSSFPGVYSRVSAAYRWIREQVCKYSSDAPSSFECDSNTDNPSSLITITDPPTSSPVSLAPTVPVAQFSATITYVDETFQYDYGTFNSGGVNVRHYTNVLGRDGVVRLESSGIDSTVYSNKVTLDKNYSRLKVVFNFYANSMEWNDRFCLDFMANESFNWREGRCWNYSDFGNDVWYDDVAVEFRVSDDVDNIRVRFRCAATSAYDDILIDRVHILGVM